MTYPQKMTLKIAIFRFANIVIFKIGLLLEPKNVPKPVLWRTPNFAPLPALVELGLSNIFVVGELLVFY